MSLPSSCHNQALPTMEAGVRKMLTPDTLKHLLDTTPTMLQNLPNKEKAEETNGRGITSLHTIITSQRLVQLRKVVDEAIRSHKTFTIKGGWNTIRNALLKRGWIEKYEPSTKPLKPQTGGDDTAICTNLPAKQEWESLEVYTIRCEKTVMSRMLQHAVVDFYWNMRKDGNDWNHRVNTQQTMNRFSRSLFTSKEGLNLLLTQMHWYNEPGVAAVTFPRCYTLGFPDHHNMFIDDYRLTSCISLLKYLVEKYDSDGHFDLTAPDGKIPHASIHFAIKRCEDFIACQKHHDIDRDMDKVWNHEWDQFLTHFHQVVHRKETFLETKEWSLAMVHANAKVVLDELKKYYTMMEPDGCRNIWMLKPGNKCRGRGIQLVTNLEEVTKVVSQKLKFVVQKYIERPLLIYDTKFDIRQWFMVTSVQPLIIWMYRECYLRFSSQIFNLENFHESLHLTNHAVQCKYTNVQQRDKALPDENMWDCLTFKAYLKQIGCMEKWDEVIFPGMRENIIGSMLACQDTMDRRPNTFEVYGADFIIDELYRPWLLEINSSPDLSCSTSVTARMCPQLLEDMLKVIVDKRRDINTDTGLFDLVYKQNTPRPPAYLGTNLSIRGRRIFKGRRYKPKEQKNKENSDNKDFYTYPFKDSVSVNLPTPPVPPKSLCAAGYNGPIIQDLIEDLHKKFFTKTEGIQFYPGKEPMQKKKAPKVERVQKPCCASPRNKVNRSHFGGRGTGAGESSRKQNVMQRKQRAMLVRSAYFGLFNDWKLRNKSVFGNGDRPKWEKDTNSILKGKTLQSKTSVQNLSNKNYTSSSVTSVNHLDKLDKISSSNTSVEKALASAPSIKIKTKPVENK